MIPDAVRTLIVEVEALIAAGEREIARQAQE